MSFEVEDLTHPSEFLSDPDYDPCQHLVDCNKPGLSRVPDDPEIFFRWFPGDQSIFELMTNVFGKLSLQEMLEFQAMHDRHLNVLEDCGIPVVSHVSWVGPSNPVLGNMPTLYAVSRRVHGSMLRHTEPKGHHLPSALLDYADRLPGMQKDGTVFLDDNLSSVQFMLPNLHPPELVDIEPGYALGAACLRDRFGDMEFLEWIDEIEDRDEVGRLARRLTVMGIDFHERIRQAWPENEAA